MCLFSRLEAGSIGLQIRLVIGPKPKHFIAYQDKAYLKLGSSHLTAGMASSTRLVLYFVIYHTNRWQVSSSEIEFSELHGAALRLQSSGCVWLRNLRFGLVETSHEKQPDFLIRYHHLMASRTPVSKDPVSIPDFRYRTQTAARSTGIASTDSGIR